jgi:hypothetical protein
MITVTTELLAKANEVVGKVFALAGNEDTLFSSEQVMALGLTADMLVSDQGTLINTIRGLAGSISRWASDVQHEVETNGILARVEPNGLPNLTEEMLKAIVRLEVLRVHVYSFAELAERMI